MQFPNGARFAFTVFDDTDRSTPENVGPVYSYLDYLGMRTTKSVWVFPPNGDFRIGGATMADPMYRDFVLDLKGKGFEIAFHNATMHTMERGSVEQALKSFYEYFGSYPKVHCNHLDNQENLYWGEDRLNSPAVRFAYRMATHGKRTGFFKGHVPGHPLYWGDLANKHLKYVRNFVFKEINTLKVNPTLPYQDPLRPDVPYWFSSTEGGTVGTWNAMLTESNQDRLEEEGGVCIMYTHFANGFVESDGTLNPRFKTLMKRLVDKGGWFVPVGTLLDYLIDQEVGGSPITADEYSRMEWRWLLSKLANGTS